MILHGLLTAAAIITIAAKFSPEFLKTMLGYQWLVDVLMHGGIMLWAATTGTFSGMIVGAITGLCISLSLSLLRRVWGFKTYDFKTREWNVQGPVWTIKSIVASTHKFFTETIIGIKDEVVAGFDARKVVNINDYRK